MDATFAGYAALSVATLSASGVSAWAALRASKRVKTKNGKSAGQHLDDMAITLADIVAWSHIHHEQDNEIREALGIRPAQYPDLPAWRNARH